MFTLVSFQGARVEIDEVPVRPEATISPQVTLPGTKLRLLKY